MAFRAGAAALVSLVAIIVVALVWSASRGAGDRPDPAAELARLVPGHRPLLARTSLAAPHAPFDPAAAAAGPAEREAIYARLLAAKVEGVPGAGAALAAFYAKRGEPGDAERALAEAVDPVDRGAVLLALDRPDEALEELAEALARRPRDPVALFNRAVALDELLLGGQAKEAWKAFLGEEPGGDWTAEALWRKESANASGRGSRSLDLLKREASLALLAARGPEGLPAIRPVAEELAIAGDRLIARSLEYLGTLDPRGWAQRAEEVRRFEAARRDVADGRDASVALRSLLGSPDPLVSVKALHFLAYGALLREDVAEASAALARLRERCRQVGCAEEIALVASDLGNLHHRSGHFQAAARSYEEGSQALPEGFSVRQSEILLKLAVVAVDEGAREKALGLLGNARRMARAAGAAPNSRVLNTTADALARLGRRAAAEAFGREAIEGASALGWTPDTLIVARAQAGRLAEWGRVGEAIELLHATLERFRETNLDAGRASGLRQLAVLLLGQGRLREAQAAVEEARLLVGPEGDPYHWLEIREVEARIAARTGYRASAITALREAVAIERNLVGLARDRLARRRIELDGAERRLLLAALLGDAGDPEGALRAFLGGDPAALQPGECRIGLATVEDRLLAFSTSEKGASFEARPVSIADVKTAIAESQRGSHAALRAAVGTVWGRGRCPENSSRIAILEPPGALAAPLAMLVHRERPSAVVGVAVAPDSRWPERLGRGAAWLVRDPLLPSGEARPQLPATDREASALREFRSGLRELQGPDATPLALREGVSDAALVHFAVHAEPRRGVGQASYLILAGERGHLEVADILALPLRARPLVVLSACNTAGVPEDLEYDGSGLPWAFLEAGAGAVIAPFETIQDDVAANFVTSFYRSLSSGATVPESVAEAARACDDLSNCGSFVLYF